MAKAVGTRELAEWVGKKSGLTTRQARQAIKLTFEGIALNLKRTEKVNITGIGSFSKKVKPAQRGGKTATNPFTGEQYITKPKPASTKVKFRPGSGFKTILGK
jgi:nucleoid DNA-binding protein